MDIVTSTSNKLIKSVSKLFSDKKYRDTTNLFVCQSEKIISTLISLNFSLRNIIVCKNSKYFDKFKKYQNCVIVDNRVYNHISHQENGDGLIAIFIKPKPSNKLDLTKSVFIFDHIQNPSNLGSILRTCAAFKINNLVLVNNCVDLYNYKVIQASMGYGLNINVYYETNLINAINMLKKNQYKVYATGINKNAEKVSKINFKRSAVLFGNEGNGLKQNQLNLCDKTIYIPINERVDSLNLSNATAIIAYLVSNENN